MATVKIGIDARILKDRLDKSAAEAHRLARTWGGRAGEGYSREFGRAAHLRPKLPDSAKIAAAGAKDGAAYARGFNTAVHGSGVHGQLKELIHGTEQLGGALGKLAMPGAVAGLVAVAGAAATASGALGLLPAALLGVGTAVGAVTVGLHDFSKALGDSNDIEKFGTDLKHLAPAAAEAATELRNLVRGPLHDLRMATQQSLFTGVAGELHDLSSAFGPQLRSALTGIAGAMNSAFHGIGNQLLSPGTSGALSATLNNIVAGFQQLAPAAAPFTDAMVKIEQIGSQFWPQMAKGITDAAVKFQTFIQNAAQTGKLQQWMRDGMDAAKELGKIVADVARIFGDLSPVGKVILPQIEGLLRSTADILGKHPGLINAVLVAYTAWNTISGVSSLITALTTVTTALKAIPALAATAGTAMTTSLAGAAMLLGDMAIAAGAVLAVMKLNDDAKNSSINTYGNDSPAQRWMNAHPQFATPPPGGIPGSSNYTPPAAPNLNPNDYMPKYDLGPQVQPNFNGNPHQAGPLQYGTDTPWSKPGLGYFDKDTNQIWEDQNKVVQQAQSLRDSRMDLAKLQQDTNASDEQLLHAKEKIAQQEHAFTQSQLDLAQAQRGKWTKVENAFDAFGELGAHLDKDLGISKGLPGLADNLVKFVASLATAPLMGNLAMTASQGNGAYGLIGSLFGGSKVQETPGFDQIQSSATTFDTSANTFSNAVTQFTSAVTGNPGQPGSGGQPGLGNAATITAGGTTGNSPIPLTQLPNGSWTSPNPAWAHLIQRESGGNPGIEQQIYDANGGPGSPNSARGLFQITPNTWARNGGPAFAPDPRLATPQQQAIVAANILRANPSGGDWGAGGPGRENAGQLLAGLLPTGGGQGLPIPAGPKLDFNSPAFSIGNAGSIPGTPKPGMPSIGPAGNLPAGPLPGPLSIGNAGYTPQAPPQPQPGWQPQSAGPIGPSGSGALGVAAASGGGLGGMSAAAAQTAIKAIERTVSFGGQVGGILTQGLMDTFSVSDPDTGKSPARESWMARIAGALAGAAPAIGTGGSAAIDKAVAQRMAQQQQSNQTSTDNSVTHNAPILNIENLHTGDQSGKSWATDVVNQLALNGANASFSGSYG